jgi:serralysin
MWLDHPHDGVRMDGVTSAFGDYGDFNLNQGIYTTMSYNTGFPNTTPGDPGNDWGYEIGPMALDIAALQEKYGANTTHATGNDVYDLPDANVSGTGWISIWDAGGTDEIRYTGSRDATIDLRAATLLYEEGGGGFVSAADSIAGGYTIANGVVIENARSGTGNDDITGNDAANRINSGRGADTIEGGAGNDVIIGAQGGDQIDGGADDDKVNGHNGADSVNGGAGKDKVIGFNGQDTLAGGTENDLLIGGAHADLFIFNLGDGRDRIKDFEDDIDTLQLDADLFNEAAPVAADIVNYAGTNAAGDVVLSFGAERIVFTGITDVNVLIDDVVIA